MRAFIIFCLLVLTLVLAGCISSDQVSQPHNKQVNDVVQKCVQVCQEEKERGADLSDGPCLSNAIAPGWVCDVAHWPREAVDNDPKNQCSEYGKSAWAFVEVDPDCKPIRVWDGTNMKILGNS